MKLVYASPLSRKIVLEKSLMKQVKLKNTNVQSQLN
jgi:hypothetical protein